MKITYNHGLLQATPETLEEIELLLGFSKPEKTPRNGKGKRHHLRPCKLCGQSFRGKKGLCVHQRYIHPDEFISNEKHAIL